MKLKIFLLVLLALTYSNFSNAQSVSITSSATNNTISSGSSVTFTASATGYATPTYQWKKNNTVISGATNSTYTTSSLNNNDQIKVDVFEGNPSVSTTGLVLNLDAGNSSSYTGSTTTWTDLTGRGNDGTITNGITYNAANGGYFQFPNGSFGGIILPASSNDFNFTTGDFAAELWVNAYNNQARLISLNTKSDVTSTALTIFPVTGGGFYAGSLYTTGFTWSVWHHVVYTRISSIVSLYIDGVLKATATDTSNLPSNSASTSNTIGAFIATSNYLSYSGKISIARVYKASGLTSSQVVSNYNTVCSRYGLNAIGSNSNTITTTVNNSIILTSATDTNAQTIANNDTLTNITYTTTGATGATFSGLPTGVTGSWSNNSITISGTPTIAGIYNYTVTLTGGNGTVTATGTITVKEVTITSSISGSSICAGTSVTFTATASGFTTPFYQWYKNGNAISGATNSTYSTSALSNNDQINVTCSNTANIVNDSSLKLWLDASNTSSYTSGTAWNDLSGNNNNATLINNASFDPISKSIVTNGIDQYISVPLFNSSTTNITMQTWVYINANSHGGFMSNGTSSYSIGIGSNVSGEMNNNGNQAWMLFSSVRYINTNSTYPTGWHLVTMTMDANATPSYYLDSAFVYTSPGSLPNTPSDSFNLGAVPGDGPKFYNGKFAAAYFYNRALTANEISQNYNATVGTIGGVSTNNFSSNTITTSVSPVPSASVTVSGDACINKTTLSTTSGLTSYTWYKDNVAISGATNNSYIPTAAGDYKVVVSNGTCNATSTATTISNCGVTADGSMSPILTTLVSNEGGINFGTGINELGSLFNSTGLTTTTGTIAATTAVIGGIISATNAVTSSIGVIYSTDANFGTYSSSTIQSNVVSGTYTTTITGLTGLTTYYAKSFIVNKAGTSYGPVVSFTTTTPPVAVGDVYGGGIVFYVLQPGDNGYDANVQHGLIAPFSNTSRQSTNPLPPIVESQIGLSAATISGAQNDDLLFGMTNTEAIIANQGLTGTYAALYCRNYVNPTSKTFNSVTYTFPVFNDWYMPSIAEIHKFRAYLYTTHYSLGSFYNFGNNLIYYRGAAGNGNDYAWGKMLSSSMTGQRYKLYYFESGWEDGSTAYNGWGENDRLVVMPIRSF